MDFLTASHAMISPTANWHLSKSSYVISGFSSSSISDSAGSSALLSPSASAFLWAYIALTFSITSAASSLAKRISGFSVTWVPDTYFPNTSSSSVFLKDVCSCAAIFMAVLGMKGSRRLAPMVMPSTRLYKTSASLGFLSSSFAKIQGVVSSIYLLHLLNMEKISVSASATRSCSILASVFLTAFMTVAFRSSSTGSVTPVLVTRPPKYLLLMLMVRFTRLPSVFAKSEFILSIISSQVMMPSFSNGISWSTK